MLTKNYPFEKESVLSTQFQLLKPNCHFPELQIQKVIVSMVTRVSFCFQAQ